MTTTAAPTTEPSTEPSTTDRAGELAERLFGAALGGVELLTVELGRRLGLYRVLDEHGPLTAHGVAEAAGIAERYAREWLEQQSSAGILEVALEGDAAQREYLLPAAHASVLVDPLSPFHMMGAAMMVEGAALVLPAVADAFRTGGGVAFAEYGAELREGIATLNRPMFTHETAGWVAELPDVAARLEVGGIILDAGCGVGWSSIALARAFPRARVIGVDLDAASVAQARLNADAADVSDRVSFVVADVEDEAAIRSRLDEDYALITVFEALHDMGNPVAALTALRGVLAPGGAVLVADERVGDEFRPNADPVERINYAFSVLHCLPASMAESPATAHGTVLRTPTMRRWAKQAGFSRVSELPIENMLWRFSRID